MGVRICYADESGDTRPLATGTSNISPLCVIAGIVVEQSSVQNLTQEFIQLKAKRFPNLMPLGKPWLSRMLVEIKGADLRRAMRDGAPRRNRRHTLGFLDSLVKLLEDYEAQIFGRIWVKNVGDSVAESALYGSSVQAICAYFQALLAETGDEGLVIADSRTPALNTAVSHSVFTQKFKASGDRYGRLLEMPTFGHSENHAGLQIADLLASALLFPMATHAYCLGHVQSIHVQNDFGILRSRYGPRLRRLQYRYRDSDGRRRGGITVDDRISQCSGGRMFRT